jgi:hypothetical protein
LHKEHLLRSLERFFTSPSVTQEVSFGSLSLTCKIRDDS